MQGQRLLWSELDLKRLKEQALSAQRKCQLNINYSGSAGLRAEGAMVPQELERDDMLMRKAPACFIQEGDSCRGWRASGGFLKRSWCSERSFCSSHLLVLFISQNHLDGSAKSYLRGRF